MDESFDPPQKGVFVVGGLLGRGVPLFELERRWKATRGKIGIEYFKASECQSGTGQFARFVADAKNVSSAERAHLDSISHEFLNLIIHPVHFDNQSYLCIQGLGVVQNDFYEVIKDTRARSILGDTPYRLAYDLAMIQCAWAMKELEKDNLNTLDSKRSREYVSFVCDEHAEHRLLANEAYRNLKKTNPAAAEYMATFFDCRRQEV